MNVHEEKPRKRTFHFSPDQNDPECYHQFPMAVEIDPDRYLLTVLGALQVFNIHIKKKTSDCISDLLSMTQEELVAGCTRDQIFLEDFSKKQTLKNIRSICKKHKISVNDPSIASVINEIADRSVCQYGCETNSFGAGQFKSNVTYLLKNTALAPYTDQIVYVKTEHHHVVLNAIEMITKHLFPILKQEIENNTDEITKEEIMRGLQEGLIEIFNNNADGCISARLGGYWFYFAGSEDEYLQADVFLERYSYDVIADMIHDTLNDKQIKGSDEVPSAEWQFYKCALRI